MSELVLKLSEQQALHYIRGYSYDILHTNSSDTFVSGSIRKFISEIKDSEAIIGTLYVLLKDYAEEQAKLSDEDKNSSLYYNLSDFIHFHHIFSTLNKTYKEKYGLSMMLIKIKATASKENNRKVLDWLNFYNV